MRRLRRLNRSTVGTSQVGVRQLSSEQQTAGVESGVPKTSLLEVVTALLSGCLGMPREHWHYGHSDCRHRAMPAML